MNKKAALCAAIFLIWEIVGLVFCGDIFMVGQVILITLGLAAFLVYDVMKEFVKDWK